jgi:hypothetical protein
MAFNSREYEWADVTLILGGQDIIGVRAVKYDEEIEQEHLYAKGRTPHSIQRGNIAYKGEIAMLQSEYDELVAAGNGSVLGLNMDAEVNYGNSPDPTKTDRLMGVRFSRGGKDIKQNDKFQEIVLPCLFLKLEQNV